MNKKILISGIISIFYMLNMEGQTKNSSINSKWIVYNTVDSALTGWHSFMDSYILDFTDTKNLKIKTLGDDEIVDVPYTFNTDNGLIYEDTGEILYGVLKLDSNKLSLKMGEKSTTTVSLIKLENSGIPVQVAETLEFLKKDKWVKDFNSIQFTDEPYKALNQIETKFNVFIEQDEKNKKEYKGAWMLDSYDGVILLELFSERFNHKAIYQIRTINDESLKAISTSDKGELLPLEFTR